MKPEILPGMVVAGVVSRVSGFADDDAGASGGTASPPYPPSPVIAGIEWASLETIVRCPKGSDNFLLTWSADGRTLHLVFSGDDHFCVRKATLKPRQPTAATATR